LLVKITKDPYLGKKKQTNSNNKSSASRTLEDLGGLSIEDLEIFFYLQQQREERREAEHIRLIFVVVTISRLMQLSTLGLFNVTILAMPLSSTRICTQNPHPQNCYHHHQQHQHNLCTNPTTTPTQSLHITNNNNNNNNNLCAACQAFL
jgi:hypothetical protein